MQRVMGSAPPLHRRSACSYLLRCFQAQTVNNGRKQTTTTESKDAPPLPTSKRRNKQTDEEKQYKKKEMVWAREKNKAKYWSVISEVEGAARFGRTQDAMQR